MSRNIAHHLVRGEIDNRERGRLVGRLWVAGREEPVVLDLVGNPRRDLAGRRLEFINPFPFPWAAGVALPPAEAGLLGHCTAASKRRFAETIPTGYWHGLLGHTRRRPDEWVNCLWLDWLSPTSGHIVVVASYFQMNVDLECTWTMSAAAEAREEKLNQKRSLAWVRSLPLAERERLLALSWRGQSPDEGAAPREASPVPADVPPLTEDEAQRMIEESELVRRRTQGRVRRELIGDDKAQALEEAQLRRERGPLLPLEAAKRARCDAELHGANLDETERAVLWEKHPFDERVTQHEERWLLEALLAGWLPRPDRPGAQYSLASIRAFYRNPLGFTLRQWSNAACAIHCALMDARWPQPPACCARSIFYLRRACRHLDRAERSAAEARAQDLATSEWLDEVQCELGKIHRECERLIGELRARLAALPK